MRMENWAACVGVGIVSVIFAWAAIVMFRWVGLPYTLCLVFACSFVGVSIMAMTSKGK